MTKPNYYCIQDADTGEFYRWNEPDNRHERTTSENMEATVFIGKDSADAALQMLRRRFMLKAKIVPSSMLSEWLPVVFAADCDEDGNCPNHPTVDFADCPCIGPTEDDCEYREVKGVMYGRRKG